MMQQDSVSVPEMQRWLAGQGDAAAASLLLGCELDDGESLQTVRIVALDLPASLRVEGGARILLARVQNGMIVDPRPGAPLVAAVLAARSPAEQDALRRRSELLRLGINPDRLGGDDAMRSLLDFLRALREEQLPGDAARQAAYRAFMASGDAHLARLGAGFFRQCLARCEAQDAELPGDLYWRIAKLLRLCGELDEAVAVSAALHGGKLASQYDRELLATTRCAALIDLWERRHDAALLREAEKAFRVAYGIARGGDELKALGRRLTGAQRQAGLLDG